MANDIKVPADEVVAIFDLLEEINHLFHQPLRYRDVDLVEQFAKRHYPEIHRLYYDVVSDLLPPEKRREIGNR